MKRSLVCLSCLTFVLIVASQCDRSSHHAAPGHVTHPIQSSPAALDVGREFLRALSTGDVVSATKVSTPLMAARISHLQPNPVRGSVAMPTFELLVLAADDYNADLAAELHWSGGRIAALRLRLVKLPDGWRVGEVQS